MNKPFNYWEDYQYVIVFIPIIVGISSMLFSKSLKKIGEKIKARPNPSAFGIIWTILYLLIGVAWALNISYYSQNNTFETLTSNNLGIISNVFYSLLIFVLFIWPICYTRTRIGNKYALYVLAIGILLTVLCMCINPMVSNICMSFLLVWLVFALLLNFTDVNN
jgi:tryptophan-rich sensory protein